MNARPILMAAAFLGLAAFSAHSSAAQGQDRMFPELQNYIAHRLHEFEQIPDERQAELAKIADYLREQLHADRPARLVFICTHNSRRSQLAQVWAAAAAARYGAPRVEVFSGGTEATAFNPRAVAACTRAGFKVQTQDDGPNPRYAVRFQEPGEPLRCFSKVYDDRANPNRDFCAVMTCSQADRHCPHVAGCALRVSLPYDDPKAADDTSDETARYDACQALISRDMLYLFSRVGR